MRIFQKSKAGKNSTIVQSVSDSVVAGGIRQVTASGRGSIAAGGNITGNVVTGNGNRTAMAGSHHNVFGDRSSSVSVINNVTVKQQGSRVDVDLPKGYTLYINGEHVSY